MATKTPNKMDDTREMTSLRSAALSSDDVPSQVLLAPWGQVESTNGSFIVDEESARLAQQAFEGHGTDLPIDYEHQTLGGSYSSPSGQAPAAGWIKRLYGEPGIGLLAEIEWTDQGRIMLASKQYRYLSPVAIVRKANRKLVAIHSAALTNKPAIIGMQPIVNRTDASQDCGEHPLALLRAELDLPDDAEPDEVLLAASRRLVDLGSEAAQRQVEQRVREAMRAGKLVEAQRAWAEAMVAREEGLFDEWLRTAPVVITPGSTSPPPAGDGPGRRRQVVVAQARVEFRDSSLLGRLTTEEAYVADALRSTR
jgi:phage I-like protein